MAPIVEKGRVREGEDGNVIADNAKNVDKSVVPNPLNATTGNVGAGGDDSEDEHDMGLGVAALQQFLCLRGWR